MEKLPKAQIRNMMQIATAETELRMARLSHWKRVAQNSPNHSQLLTAMFGDFGFDTNGADYFDHSRYKLLAKDLLKLREYDSTNSLAMEIDNPMALFEDDELREDFAVQSFKELRAAEVSTLM